MYPWLILYLVDAVYGKRRLMRKHIKGTEFLASISMLGFLQMHLINVGSCGDLCRHFARCLLYIKVAGLN